LAKTSIAVIRNSVSDHLAAAQVDSAAGAVTILDVPPEDDLYEVEVLDGELVSHPGGQLEPVEIERLPQRRPQPAVQTAVAVATGFVAGAATMALLRRYGQARIERPLTAAPPVEPPRPGHARTYVVHVRQLG
jgi:hypothetical protein